MADEKGPDNPEQFPTPGVRTIEDLTTFKGGASADRQIKTLVYVADGQIVLALLRGDHPLNETKLAAAAGAVEVRPAHPEEIRQLLGALPGSLGAVGLKDVPIYADQALRGRTNMVTGANKDDFHLRGVSMERDIPNAKWSDLRTVASGEGCPNCDGILRVDRAIEIGHIFKLGTRYSETLGARVLNAEGKEVPIVMGSYGIGLGRILAAAVELYNDQDGIKWPLAIAPFQIIVTPANLNDETQRTTAQNIYDQLAAEYDVLLDDREERPGVKFKDADLIGIPYRVTIGNKLKQGRVELFSRKDRETKEVPVESILQEIRSTLGRLQ
jgi:prolyl-tRNA synthetase